jgi:hypothetical protein
VIETTFTLNNHPAPTEKIITKGETGKQYLYVFGNLLSQGLTIPNESNDSFILTAVRRFIATISLLHYQLGGACPSKRIPYRLVAGVWTLGAFFFVQAYTSTLFTYVVTPNNRPLIDSVYDVINNGDVNLLVRESGFMNILISARKQNFNVLQQHQNN